MIFLFYYIFWYSLKQMPLRRVLRNLAFRMLRQAIWHIIGISGFLALFFLVISNIVWSFFSNALMSLLLYFAFNSVEHIMRDVILRLVIIDIYMHNGASFFFIVVYLHYVPCLYYGHIQYMFTLFIMGCWSYYIFFNDLLLHF